MWYEELPLALCWCVYSHTANACILRTGTHINERSTSTRETTDRYYYYYTRTAQLGRICIYYTHVMPRVFTFNGIRMASRDRPLGKHSVVHSKIYQWIVSLGCSLSHFIGTKFFDSFIRLLQSIKEKKKIENQTSHHHTRRRHLIISFPLQIITVCLHLANKHQCNIDNA